MNTLTIKEIRKYPHLQKRQTTSVQKKSGLSLIVENEKNQCKRFEGLIRHNKKLIHVPLGVFGNDIKTQQHLNSCLLYTSPSPRDKRQSRMPSSA